MSYEYGDSQHTALLNSLFCNMTINTNDTTEAGSYLLGFVLARIDWTARLDNGLYQLALFIVLLFDSAFVRLEFCIYTPLTVNVIDSSFLPNPSSDRPRNMSQYSGLAMTPGKSVPSPQGTSPNTVAAITTLMTNLSTSSSAGPDRLTSLPMELMQQVASNLSAHSVMALRITNKTAAAKTFTNFVETCLYSLTIQTTTAGVNYALRFLKFRGASKATTHVTFTAPPTIYGPRSTSLAGVPSQADLQTLMAQLPNAVSIMIRDNTLHGLNV
jgi:hypothetical protein